MGTVVDDHVSCGWSRKIAISFFSLFFSASSHYWKVHNISPASGFMQNGKAGIGWNRLYLDPKYGPECARTRCRCKTLVGKRNHKSKCRCRREMQNASRICMSEQTSDGYPWFQVLFTLFTIPEPRSVPVFLGTTSTTCDRPCLESTEFVLPIPSWSEHIPRVILSVWDPGTSGHTRLVCSSYLSLRTCACTSPTLSSVVCRPPSTVGWWHCRTSDSECDWRRKSERNRENNEQDRQK